MHSDGNNVFLCKTFPFHSITLCRLQREEAQIAAWEELQKAKAEAAIRKLEVNSIPALYFYILAVPLFVLATAPKLTRLFEETISKHYLFLHQNSLMRNIV